MLSAALAILTAGCSSEKSVTFQSGGLTQTISEGKDAVPSNSVLPVYPGATASGSVSAEGKQEGAQFIMLSTNDPPDKVSEFYQDKLKDKGWEIDKVDVSNPNATTITAHLKDTEANVLIAVDSGKTMISLQSSKSDDDTKPDEENSENYQPNKTTPPTD